MSLSILPRKIEARKSKLENRNSKIGEEQKPFFRQPTDKVAKGAKKTKRVSTVDLCGLAPLRETVYSCRNHKSQITNRKSPIGNRKSAIQNRQSKILLPLPMAYDRERQGQVTAFPVSLDLQIPVARIILGDGGKGVAAGRRSHQKSGMGRAGSLPA